MNSSPCQIEVKLAKQEGRKSATMKDRNGQSYKAPVFMVKLNRISLISHLGWRGRQRQSPDSFAKQRKEAVAFGD